MNDQLWTWGRLNQTDNAIAHNETSSKRQPKVFTITNKIMHIVDEVLDYAEVIQNFVLRRPDQGILCYDWFG